MGLYDAVQAGRIAHSRRLYGGKGAFMSGENNNGNAAQVSQQVDSSAAGENQPAGGSQQTYTFDELNAHTDRVVKERIDKQNEKHSKQLAAKDKELEAERAKVKELEEKVSGFEATKERNEIISKVAEATGLSVEQIALLKGDTEEELAASANTFKASMPSLYPDVNSASGKQPPVTKDDILKIKNSEERVAAMGRHSELFR